MLKFLGGVDLLFRGRREFRGADGLAFLLAGVVIRYTGCLPSWITINRNTNGGCFCFAAASGQR